MYIRRLKNLIARFVKGIKIYVCEKFQDMSVVDRETVIQETLRCKNYLAKNHSISNGLSNVLCKICNCKHHYLLHNENLNKLTDSVSNDNVSATPSTSKERIVQK